MTNQRPPEVYRPTVRYDPIYQAYVNRLFHATTLDRNEIIRLALFCAPQSAMFRSKVETYLRAGQSFPICSWNPQDKYLWKAGEANGETSGAANGKRNEGEGPEEGPGVRVHIGRAAAVRG